MTQRVENIGILELPPGGDRDEDLPDLVLGLLETNGIATSWCQAIVALVAQAEAARDRAELAAFTDYCTNLLPPDSVQP